MEVYNTEKEHISTDPIIKKEVTITIEGTQTELDLLEEYISEYVEEGNNIYFDKIIGEIIKQVLINKL